jgi:hypothetical protein
MFYLKCMAAIAAIALTTALLYALCTPNIMTITVGAIAGMSLCLLSMPFISLLVITAITLSLFMPSLISSLLQRPPVPSFFFRPHHTHPGVDSQERSNTYRYGDY